MNALWVVPLVTWLRAVRKKRAQESEIAKPSNSN